MNPDEDAELNHILARADFIEGGKPDDELELSPELVGVVMTPAVDAVTTQGMTPPPPSNGREGVV